MNAPAEVIPANVTIAAPNPELLRRGAASALDLVSGFEVVDAATFEIAADELKAIKTKKDALTEQRLGLTRPLDGVKTALMNLFRNPIELLEQAEEIIKGKMLTYQRAEAAKAREAQLAAERAAQAERDRIQAEADALAAAGRTGEAVVKEQVAAMIVAAPVAAPPPPAAKGISTRETVEFEVINLAHLIEYIATGRVVQPGERSDLKHPELLNLLMHDSTKVRNYVRGLGLQCNLPGVNVFPKHTLAARKC